MDDEKIINVAEEAAKKQPWYKRAWKSIKKGWSKFVDWLEEWWDDVIFPILAVIWAFTIGFIYGKIFGLLDKENNTNHYDAGKKAGDREGYLAAMQDLKDSGYQVYGGYNEDCGKLIVTKLTEQAIEPENKAE